MAKHKKKRKKKKRFQHSKKDKFLYILISFIPLITIFIFAIFTDSFTVLNKYFYNGELLLCKPETNGFTVLYFIMFFIVMIGGFINSGSLMEFDISFKDFVNGKDIIAKKYAGFSFSLIAVAMLVFIVCGILQFYSVTSATMHNISNNHLMAEDTITEYDEINSAELYIKMYFSHAGSGTLRVPTATHYKPVVTVTINGKKEKFDFSDFDNNYSNVKAFLDCIDSSKITVDKTYYNELLEDTYADNEAKALFAIK